MGVVLRLPVLFAFPPERLTALQAEPTYFPLELAAFEAHPTLLLASYGAFLAGNLLMWPAILTLAGLISASRPGWAFWGGTMAMFGLFARTFHAGVDHFAFQLVRVQGLDLATRVIADSYVAVSFGPYHLIGVLGFAVVIGWVVLAIGAYLSGTLGLLRSVSLGLTALLFQGVLKGSAIDSVALATGLLLALTPLGIQLLRGRASRLTSDPQVA